MLWGERHNYKRNNGENKCNTQIHSTTIHKYTIHNTQRVIDLDRLISRLVVSGAGLSLSLAHIQLCKSMNATTTTVNRDIVVWVDAEAALLFCCCKYVLTKDLVVVVDAVVDAVVSTKVEERHTLWGYDF